VRTHDIPKSLETQKQNLENLCLSHEDDFPTANLRDKWMLMDSSGFTNLKNLKISAIYLCCLDLLLLGTNHRDRQLAQSDIDRVRMRGVHRLPGSLETLHLYHCYQRRTAKLLVPSLQQLLHLRVACFPLLGEIAIHGICMDRPDE
jgi:hypothetical protein